MNILNGQNLFDVSGKVVLITGAATGLGEGYAHIFAESGCKVACADIQFEKVCQTAEDICAQGFEAKAFEVDVTRQKSIRKMAAEILQAYGRIDVLVNNAGVEHIEPFTEVSEEHYDFITSVNLKGVFFVAQAIAKIMKKQGGGKIINIGSLGSYIGLAESSVYCTTKGGVIQMSKTMSIELGPDNIQVNCVAPGYFITPMTQPFYDDAEHRAWIESRIPLHNWGTVKDLAGPMLFLASDASNYVTGATIKVDGGWLAS